MDECKRGQLTDPSVNSTGGPLPDRGELIFTDETVAHKQIMSSQGICRMFAEVAFMKVLMVTHMDECWSYDPTSDTWTTTSKIGIGEIRLWAASAYHQDWGIIMGGGWAKQMIQSQFMTESL